MKTRILIQEFENGKKTYTPQYKEKIKLEDFFKCLLFPVIGWIVLLYILRKWDCFSLDDTVFSDDAVFNCIEDAQKWIDKEIIIDSEEKTKALEIKKNQTIIKTTKVKYP